MALFANFWTPHPRDLIFVAIDSSSQHYLIKVPARCRQHGSPSFTSHDGKKDCKNKKCKNKIFTLQEIKISLKHSKIYNTFPTVFISIHTVLRLLYSVVLFQQFYTGFTYCYTEGKKLQFSLKKGLKLSDRQTVYSWKISWIL